MKKLSLLCFLISGGFVVSAPAAAQLATPLYYEPVNIYPLPAYIPQPDNGNSVNANQCHAPSQEQLAEKSCQFKNNDTLYYWQ